MVRVAISSWVWLVVASVMAGVPGIEGAVYTDADIVDLTTTLKTNESMHWPSFAYGFSTEVMMDLKENNYWMEAYGFKMAIHTGTHMDAPCHVTPRQDVQHLQEVPLERFFGPGCVMDIEAKVDGNPDYMLSMDDFRAWEEQHGQVPEGAIVLVHTGWYAKHAGSLKDYYGTENVSIAEELSFPGVATDVVELLVDERNINALGIDNGSPDSAPQCREGFPVHLKMLGNNRLILENVAPTVGTLPPTGYRIHAVPLKLHGTCGSPIRLLAFKETSRASSNARVTYLALVMSVIAGVLASFVR